MWDTCKDCIGWLGWVVLLVVGVGDDVIDGGFELVHPLHKWPVVPKVGLDMGICIMLIVIRMGCEFEPFGPLFTLFCTSQDP